MNVCSEQEVLKLFANLRQVEEGNSSTTQSHIPDPQDRIGRILDQTRHILDPRTGRPLSNSGKRAVTRQNGIAEQLGNLFEIVMEDVSSHRLQGTYRVTWEDVLKQTVWGKELLAQRCTSREEVQLASNAKALLEQSGRAVKSELAGVLGKGIKRQAVLSHESAFGRPHQTSTHACSNEWPFFWRSCFKHGTKGEATNDLT